MIPRRSKPLLIKGRLIFAHQIRWIWRSTHLLLCQLPFRNIIVFNWHFNIIFLFFCNVTVSFSLPVFIGLTLRFLPCIGLGRWWVYRLWLCDHLWEWNLVVLAFVIFYQWFFYFWTGFLICQPWHCRLLVFMFLWVLFFFYLWKTCFWWTFRPICSLMIVCVG